MINLGVPYQPKMLKFVFKMPPKFDDYYIEVVRMTVISFISQQKQDFTFLSDVNVLSKMLNKIGENELVQLRTEDIHSGISPSKFNALEGKINLDKAKEHIDNNSIHILIELGVIRNLDRTPIQVSL
jgi:hypothetical protein